VPYLVEFKPDIIFISAGFDAHKRDNMNFGYVGMIEEDYEWLTEQLVKVSPLFVKAILAAPVIYYFYSISNLALCLPFF
jgi:acetoin utilization deacetylase AcuC-like enzyme